MTAFIAHPSVRIKGSEHMYNPVLCQEESCSGKGTHMHCPLCTVTEAYQDPVILRAHFRIKHVDKGIDFSGLKILRCCNHCEIVGTIKGEKRFKGAHWHCYRCRNGFNRRDETIKHYKTHFRNPHTTFQIQISQEVNCRRYYDCGADAHSSAYAGPVVSAELAAETGAVTAVLSQRVLDTSESLHTLEAKDNCINNGIIVTSEEDVESSEHSIDKTQTLVLMGREGHGGSLVYEETENIVTEQDRNGLEPTVLLEQKVLELQQQNEILQLEKDSMERRLQAEIQKLQQQVSTMVQTNLKLSEELKQYQSVENGHNRVETLVKSLEEQHRILLQTQLATLSRELLNKTDAIPLSGHMGTEEVTVGLNDVGAKGTDEVNIVEVTPAVEDLRDVDRELVNTEMDSEGSGAVVVQSTAEPLSGRELLLSRKRRPEDEPQQDEQTKLQCI